MAFHFTKNLCTSNKILVLWKMRESKTQIIGKMIRAEQDELNALFKKREH